MFRRFKNIVFIVLSISMIFTLIACNSSKDENDKVTLNPSEIKDKVKDRVVSLLPKEEQDLVMNSYYKLLTENKMVDNISNKYKAIIENNKGSKTSEILSQYVDLLESENGDLNSNQVNGFYDRLDIIIEDMFIKWLMPHVRLAQEHK